ncbi:tape measure protein [Paracoccus siganidrum]|uniref:Phage tail tape measure protein n=1 Tax=Paracoccus siganidrum TaxID=1276757 RepID=A0A419A1R7_9RHOB|nr:tape measure protein [Paracoccus siganidrum]RJL06931.1 phage tail tape measure protein [Paracoccus siganidrum]RMC27245.1 phage tail tape measure protein [Paracoccus siganidrum]
MAEKKVSVRLVAENGRQVRAELEGIGDAGARSFQKLSKEIDTTGVMLRRLAGIAAGAFSIRQVVQYADTWTDLRSRVDLATGSQEKGAAVMERLADMARRTYSSLDQTTESWIANSTALRELGLSTTESLDFTEALNNAMVVSGARAERAASVQYALSKAMATGTLRGEELNRIIESGGRLAELLAAELGTTVSGLRQLGPQGAITGDVIRTALVGNLELLREEADSMPATIGDAFTLIGNAALQLVGSWDQLLGASSTVAEVLILVADNLERLASIGVAFAGFMAGRWVTAFVAARVATFSLATALTALRGALIRTGIGALIVAAGELIYQFSSLVKAAGGIGTAFRLLGGLAREVGQRIGTAFQAAFALLGAAWEGYRALVFTVLDAIVKGAVTAVDRYVAVWLGGFEAIKAIWGALPDAIGDFAFQAANGLIAGVEAMLNGVVTRINNFIGGINSALAMLPDWAVGEGGAQIGLLDPFNLGRINNPFEGGASAAGASAADAFSEAFGRTYVEALDLFGGSADQASAAAAGYLEAAGELAAATVAPLESWQALQDAVTTTGEDGADALDDAAGAADRVAGALDKAGGAAGRAGAAGKKAGADTKAGADEAKLGWDAVAASLSDYADKARNIGGDIGSALVNAFQGAENAIGEFVKTGKMNFRDLVTSMLADLAKLGARRFLLGPLAGVLSGFMPGLGGLSASILHSGGMVGSSGPSRLVPAMAFANAPRMHNGGWAGLRSDEVPAILQKGERVLSRREAAGYGQGVTVNIAARDAESFRQSRAQIGADIARAVAMGRRGM